MLACMNSIVKLNLFFAVQEHENLRTKEYEVYSFQGDLFLKTKSSSMYNRFFLLKKVTHDFFVGRALKPTGSGTPASSVSHC